MEKLTSLDLYNCPVTQLKSYREQIFAFLPKLEILDGINAKGEEATQSGNGESAITPKISLLTVDPLYKESLK